MSRCECCDSVIEHKARSLVAHYDNAPRGFEMYGGNIIEELRETLQELDEEREDVING
jgi:hypothetical protein